IFRRSTGAVWPSALVAGLFALHPLHVESVAWITERKDVLSTLFGFAALWFYIRYVRNSSRRAYVAALVAFALSLLAKGMLVTLPFVLLLRVYGPLGRVASGGRRMANGANKTEPDSKQGKRGKGKIRHSVLSTRYPVPSTQLPHESSRPAAAPRNPADHATRR